MNATDNRWQFDELALVTARLRAVREGLEDQHDHLQPQYDDNYGRSMATVLGEMYDTSKVANLAELLQREYSSRDVKRVFFLETKADDLRRAYVAMVSEGESWYDDVGVDADPRFNDPAY